MPAAVEPYPVADPLNEIPGFFDYGGLFSRVVREAPPCSLLVEVGVYCGRSLCHLARAARAADKGLRVLGVDWFRGDPGVGEHDPALLSFQAIGNLHRFGLLGNVQVLVAESGEAARLLADRSAHFVFIDGAHDEDAVARDVERWGPKLAPGGVLAGHDVGYGTVRAALDRFAFRWRVVPESPSCWEAVV
jgi:predicted O-methyltransferase YrrM